MLPSGFTPIDVMSDQEIQALKDRFERSGPPPKFDAVVTAIFFTIIGSVVLSVLLVELWPEMIDRTWRGMALLAGVTVAVAGVGFWAREIRRFWFYGFLEIGIGIVISTQVAARGDPIIALVGFVGAARISLEGIARLWKLIPPDPKSSPKS
jgi:hypothetical protein